MNKKVINILWIISMLTWALPLNIIYTFVFLAYIIAWRKRIINFEYIENRIALIVNVGEFFGGLELGYAVILQKNKNSLEHELGHTLQSAIWGLFYLFVIWMPSAIRYNYREYLWKRNYKKWQTLKPYDTIWFEKQATNWGEKLYGKN